MAKTENKVWVVSIDMGYGHQRTAYALKGIAQNGEIISANNYKGILKRDQKLWKQSRSFYEFISRFKNIPVFGDLIFSLYDRFQSIVNFYPKRDLSKAGFVEESIYSLLKHNWGKHLINKLSKNSIPLVTTFFNVAFMAEYFNYPCNIFCIVCDTDISRGWAPLDPKNTRIKYFAPTIRVAERLKLYGVKLENIHLTGYPLPEENIGLRDSIIKEDLKNRLVNLDPKKAYFKKYDSLVLHKLGEIPKKSNHPLTIMYSIGGAGAQVPMAIKVAKALKDRLKKGKVKLIFSAGTRKEVKDYFEKHTKGIDNIEIIYEKDFESYYNSFNKALRTTDLLWTKPSELSFYAMLAIPIIIAPEIGSQEKFNKRWIENSGFGISEQNPEYINDWLFDWIDRGFFAEMAMNGFIKGERNGIKNMKRNITRCSGY
ncbi:MAG: hypothetical protein PHX52_01560 [Candidatus Pacebacteria bacterium]|nr:hypothetical protein [Candidatus Paceibacterota bacterium]MDD3919253.1 hypothetical protein [Candidatus Paceibacterota bacterium]